MKMSRRLLVQFALVGVTALTAILAGKLIYNHHQVYNLTIATGGKEGEYYAFGQALSQTIAQRYPRIRLQVVETSGSRENMQLLENKKVQLAIAQSDTPGTPGVRSVATLFPEAFYLIAAQHAQIRQVLDLKGKRVAIMPKGSGSYVFFWQLLEHYGLTQKDLQAVPLRPSEAYEQFRRGKFDAVFRSIAVGNQGIKKLIQNTSANLVPINQVAALKISLPYLESVTIPQGTYRGNPPVPTTDLTAASIHAVMLAHAEVNKEIVREITASLYEYRNELVAKNPLFSTIRPPGSREGLGLPLHQGAKAFYTQDEPNFLERNAEVMGFMLSASLLCVSGLWNLRSRLIKRQKNRGDAYNLKVIALVEQINNAQDFESLESVRKQLFEIFKRVITDLDEDKISPEAFQAFSVPWQVAITTIQHRELILHSQITPFIRN